MILEVVNENYGGQYKSIDYKWHKAFGLQITKEIPDTKETGYRGEKSSNDYDNPVCIRGSCCRRTENA